MSFPVVFRPQAERELLEAEQWYEDRSPGLGRKFRTFPMACSSRWSTIVSWS